jgi:heterodisulfide reductase subunit C
MAEKNVSLAAELKKVTDVDVRHCYQCGKCSAGCAQAPEMDYMPNTIIRMIQTGDPELMNKVLRSFSIWLCLSCEVCHSRCPMSIELPKVMDFLREKSLQTGNANPRAKKIIAFHKSFLSSVKKNGRLYELGLITEYKSRVFDLMQDVTLAPEMIAKGKLHILPEKIRDKKVISTIFSQTLKENKSK